MNMFKFGNEEFLYLLILLPVLVVIFMFVMFNKIKTIKKYGNSELLSQLMPDQSFIRPVIKFSILTLVLGLIIIALARPQFGSKLKETGRESVEIIIALDVSNSMNAQDIYPSRLEKAKRAIIKLTEKLTDDKIGIVLFAGQAYTQVPITNDFSAAKMYIESIQTGMVQSQGTAIGSAIRLGMSSFNPKNEKSKVLIVVSDGENHEDDAIEAAKLAQQKGVVIHTIGVGLPQGAPIPLDGSNDYMHDADGNPIITKLNENLLKEIAAAGKGVFVRSSNAEIGLNTVFNEINKMEKSETETYSEYADKYHYFIMLALILILFEYILLERKNKYLKNINIFK